MLIPFAAGYIFSKYIPDHFLADSSQRIVFELFFATAISVSSIPVIAKVLIDLKLIRRDIGQITIAAGMIDDTTAWIVLSIVLGLIGGGAITASTIAYSFGKVILFVILSFYFGKLIIKYLISFTLSKISSRDKILTLVIVFTFAVGAIAQAIHLEAVLGAFVAGMIIAQLPSDSKRFN